MAYILTIIMIFITPIHSSHSRMVTHHNDIKNSDSITGIWRIQDPVKKISIYIQPCAQNPNALCGKITNLDLGRGHSQPYLDIHNPLPQLQKRELLGLQILNNVILNSDNSWDDGTLYNPEDGQEYSCALKLITDDQGLPLLEARIYKGIHMFGQTRIWTR